MPKGGNKKVYKIFDKERKEYLSLGYKGKSSWLTWPFEALDTLKIESLHPENIIVEQYEMVKTKDFSIDRKEIKKD